MWITRVGEFRRYIGIAGFKDADFNSINKTMRGKVRSVDFQFFDADLVATWRHLFFAALNALKAFRDDANISKSVATETLIYASTQRQISKAIRMVGVKKTSSNVAVLAIGANRGEVESFLKGLSASVGTMDNGVLEMTREKTRSIKALFGLNQLTGVGDKPIQDTIVDALIEKMALLAVAK